MKRFYQTLCLLLVAVFFFQCQKDNSSIGTPDPTTPVVTTPVLPEPITADVQGNITDENNQPASGVIMTVGNKTAITNTTGYFRINDASLDKNTSLLSAEKAGYFKGYRVFAATEGTNQVVIKLNRRNLAGTINANTGGAVTLPNGAKVSLPANGVSVASSGAAYSGDIKVFASYIDPRANGLIEAVPGSFVADKNGQRATLSSFGMLAVELESTTGEKLQVKTGTVATLTSPIPSTALSAAPARLALSYLDEKTGLWKQDGTAIKQGNNYIGDVKHFSNWSVDSAYVGVSISATLHNPNGLPLVNVPVSLKTADAGSSLHLYTDSLGQVKGFVPANKSLTFQIIDPCGSAVYSKNIAPLTQNTDLGIITTNAGSSILTFTGTLLDCAGLPVKNGYASITFNNMLRAAATDATGKFSVTFIACAGTVATAHVLGIDETSLQKSNGMNVNISVPVTNAGTIKVCGSSIEQFIKYNLDGTDYTLTRNATINDSIVGYTSMYGTTNTTNITGGKAVSNTNYIFFAANDVTAPGTFPVSNFGIENYNNIVRTQPFNIVFTNFAKVAGEFYEGTFSGKFTANGSATAHNINASFRVMRIN